MKTQLFFKFLRKTDRTGGISDWKWPSVGEWTPPRPHLRLCFRGYHLLAPKDLLNGVRTYFVTKTGRRGLSYVQNHNLTPDEYDCYLVKADICGMLTAHRVAGYKLNDGKVCVRRARLLRKLPWRRSDFRGRESIRAWMQRNGLKLED